MENIDIKSFNNNDTLFLNNLNDFNTNITIIKNTFINLNKNTRLYIILINSNLNNIQSISEILSNYYSIIDSCILQNEFYKENIDCMILLPELYYMESEFKYINHNDENALLTRSIELILSRIPIGGTQTNRIYISNNNQYNQFNQFIKSIEYLIKPNTNYFNIDQQQPQQSQQIQQSQPIQFNYLLISKLKIYNSVYCGGFFDYFHSGHKTFLSIGSLISNSKFFTSVLSKSSVILSTPPSTPPSSPLKCNNSNNSNSNSTYLSSQNTDIEMKDGNHEQDITPPSSPRQQQQQRSSSSPSFSTQCPYNHNGYNSITSSKSSIGEIVNLNYDYTDKNNDTFTQPIEVRMATINEFLYLFQPFHKSIEVVTNTRCSDINYCPMTYFDQVDAIITIPSTSNNTLPSSNEHKINLIRLKRNLKLISIHYIKPVECLSSNNKISSSYIRSLLSKQLNNTF